MISNRNKPVFVAMPVADFEAILETMDVLADPKAMKEVAEVGSTKRTYRKLDLDDKNFGL